MYIIVTSQWVLPLGQPNNITWQTTGYLPTVQLSVHIVEYCCYTCARSNYECLQVMMMEIAPSGYCCPRTLFTKTIGNVGWYLLDSTDGSWVRPTWALMISLTSYTPPFAKVTQTSSTFFTVRLAELLIHYCTRTGCVGTDVHLSIGLQSIAW